ncbi:hypothetical protein [Mycobacterium arosiense]|uniref:Uncharacterized protein n=1 Tax=Mycobacterium arosiense ATCC BAA-1401 = DSM 45069 TaxID=1265311 RepID=A0A1W9ZAV1_MYCAI|nr:hypothetical protein [Mycobacterium arosiense]ORA10960.1 hypothetical protein BST14_19580 [Mycobacterium arosiense ATCC BAA-1401 = DSM 45069]
MQEMPIPPIEYSPPYSMDFVSHLDAGCYPDGVTQQLLAAVRCDPVGARMLDDLAVVQMELRLLRDEQVTQNQSQTASGGTP